MNRMWAYGIKLLGLLAVLSLLPLLLPAQTETQSEGRARRLRTRRAETTVATPRPAPAEPAVAKPQPTPLPEEAMRRGGRPEVFFCDIGDPQCRTNADTFDVEKIRDLFVFVTWPHLRGEHVQNLEFILPDGHLYQQIGTRFVAQTDRPNPSPRRKGGEPVSQRFLTTSRGVPTVGTVLPVAGTFITQRSLLGTWTVRVLLDGQLVTSAPFTLQRGEPSSSTIRLPSPVEDRPTKRSR